MANQSEYNNKSEWKKVVPYAVISLISFMLGCVLLFFMVWKAEQLVAVGLAGRLYYVVLLPLGLSVAGFLFGVVQSFATFKGKQFGGTLVLGGPIVAFLLVLVLGFALVQDQSTFPVTFFVHGSGGLQDIVLRNSGEVFVDLGGDRRKARIDDQGQAFFPAIPANFRSQEVLVWVQSESFESVGSGRKYRLDSQSVYLAVQKKAGRFHGVVKSSNQQCLVGVQVQIAGMNVPVDRDSGRFDISVSGDRLGDESTLDATAPGCQSLRFTVHPNSNDIVVTLIPSVKANVEGAK